LATSILSFTQRSIQDVEVEQLQEKILEAKAKGDPLATEIVQLTTDTISVPIVNRVQTVSQEDFQSVKHMWKDNYKDLEVPLELNETRNDWIQDDISNMDQIVGMLSSTNQEQAAQGLREVSHILPFLMIGGFSQTEIISYLKAKREAAREALEDINKEEETKVARDTKKEEEPKKMEQAMEESDKQTSTKTTDENKNTESSEDKPLKDVLAAEDEAEKQAVEKNAAIKQP
jgi:hypothetical protein